MTREERIDQVITAIKARPELFKMEDWPDSHTCGTPACIGGWLDRFEYARGGKVRDFVMGGTGALIGLDSEESYDLFCMDYIDERIIMDSEYRGLGALELFDELPEARRVEIAVAVLEELKASGRVTWDEFFDFDACAFTDS